MTTDLRNIVIYQSLQEENRSQIAYTFTICTSPLSHSNIILFFKIFKSSHWFTSVQVTQNTLHWTGEDPTVTLKKVPVHLYNKHKS